MHPILTNHPGYADLMAERHRIDLARQAHSERTLAESDRYRDAVARHHRERTAALLAGTDPPGQPAAPSNDPTDAHVFLGELARVDAQIAAWLTEHIDAIEKDAAQCERALLKEAQEPVVHLRGTASGLSALCSALSQARTAAGSAISTEERIDASAVVEAITAGRSLLGVSVDAGGEVDAATFEPAPPRPQPDPTIPDLRLQGRR